MTDLDPVIHAPARLRIVVVLAELVPGDVIAFPRLRSELDMTAGNLSTHLRKLEDAGYVEVTKTHEKRTPVTYLALSDAGRTALAGYRTALTAILGGTA
ncbi:transcriptional regulator [Litorihabitans aurantiacus]|uniref:MarR family transcriptional regulator n=1 Tax=Litorihabitans aurantiacus TaxID=1930061 RepID=A0AA37XH14_9MICO|nr:transcriptional regulator [Litorihabitans aurantiacus]GMA32812.1 MarR family transcriptional regulator [Litorihabitans aurantiacus]